MLELKCTTFQIHVYFVYSSYKQPEDNIECCCISVLVLWLWCLMDGVRCSVMSVMKKNRIHWAWWYKPVVSALGKSKGRRILSFRPAWATYELQANLIYIARLTHKTKINKRVTILRASSISHYQIMELHPIIRMLCCIPFCFQNTFIYTWAFLYLCISCIRVQSIVDWRYLERNTRVQFFPYLPIFPKYCI